jgi:hypothetical protein
MSGGRSHPLGVSMVTAAWWRAALDAWGLDPSPLPRPLSVLAVSVVWQAELELTPSVQRPELVLVHSFPPPYSSPCHWVHGAPWSRHHPRRAPTVDLHHVGWLG